MRWRWVDGGRGADAESFRLPDHMNFTTSETHVQDSVKALAVGAADVNEHL